MSLLTMGSAAYDTLKTPFGSRERSLGGSGVYASFASSFFTRTRLIAIVGGDWNPEYTELLRVHGVDLEGLEERRDEKTMYWSGHYFEDMNTRETLCFQGNVMTADYKPFVPESYRGEKYVFLANESPVADLALLDALDGPELVVADTMDVYIQHTPDELSRLLKRIDGLILNDSEAALLARGDAFSSQDASALTEERALEDARALLKTGPSFVVVKRGDKGAFWMSDGELYKVPAYPTNDVVDPTGAGDAFAGAMMGVLAESGTLSASTITEALIYATSVASITIEGFSLERFQYATRTEIDSRAARLRELLAE